LILWQFFFAERISFLVKRCGKERVKGWIHAVRNLAGKDRGRSGRRQAWARGQPACNKYSDKL
jgi:hypothetical protein